MLASPDELESLLKLVEGACNRSFSAYTEGGVAADRKLNEVVSDLTTNIVSRITVTDPPKLPTRKTHELKCNDEFWDDLVTGAKTFENRFNDRGYQRGDILILKRFKKNELVPGGRFFTGDWATFQVSYVLSGWGLEEGWVTLALQFIECGKGQPWVYSIGQEVEENGITGNG